jgi:FkbM family methyltransferase
VFDHLLTPPKLVMFSTATKLRAARMLNRMVIGVREAIGRNSFAQVNRCNVNWSLDLNEGIDFALYLGLYQRIPRRALQLIKPNAVIVDVGANIGAHTLPLARHVGPGGLVVAVEPADYAIAKLKVNLALNPELRHRVILANAVLGDGEIKANSFYSRWPLCNEVADRHPRHLGQVQPAATAEHLTLDVMLARIKLGRPVSFIKLDVDGHELNVLRGARDTLLQDRPALLIEIAPHVQDEVPGRLEEMVDLLGQYGYRRDNGRTLNAHELRGEVGHGASTDVLLLHASV